MSGVCQSVPGGAPRADSTTVPSVMGSAASPAAASVNSLSAESIKQQESPVPSTKVAWKENRGAAHRGDSINRDKDIQCRNCGVFGHKARNCKAGKQPAGSTIEEGFKQMGDQLEGNKRALAEMSKDNHEARKELEAKTEALKSAALELATIKSIVDVDALMKAVQMDFWIGEEDGWRIHWPVFLTTLVVIASGAWALLDHDMSVLFFVVVTFGFCHLSHNYHFGGHGLFFDERRHGTRFKTISIREGEAGPDLRPDANSLQLLKHANPILGVVEVTNLDSEESHRLRISFEMLAQLTAPKYMTLAADPKTALARIVRAAESIQTVNFDRYGTFTGKNVAMQTAQVAWALWCHQHEGGVLDFIGAPQL